jgi:hypothetical protein
MYPGPDVNLATGPATNRKVVMEPADEDAFAAFVRARGEHFLRVAVLVTGSPAEAEDLLQASLVNLYRAWARLDVAAGPPDAYLRKILVNTRRSARDSFSPPVDNRVVSTSGGGRLVSGSRASARSWRLRERPR